MVSMNLTEFKANLKSSGARANLFNVKVTFPPEVPQVMAAASFLIKAASLPAMTIGTIEVPYRGRVLKFAGNRTFDDWSITIINDEDFLIRDAFERWSNFINGLETNKMQLTTAYMAMAEVQQLGKAGNVLREYTIKDMFPTSVAAIELSYETADAIEEFEVTLAYQWFEVTKPTSIK